MPSELEKGYGNSTPAPNVLPTEVRAKATASLQKEIEDELNTPDPTKEEAKAAIKDNSK